MNDINLQELQQVLNDLDEIIRFRLRIGVQHEEDDVLTRAHYLLSRVELMLDDVDNLKFRTQPELL